MEFNAYTYRDFLKDKNCLVIGMARSGISMVKTLSRLGSNVTANDLKNKDELIEAVDALSQYNVNFQLGCKPDEFLEGMDLIILSPSLPIKLPFIKKAMDMGIEVIGEIELAYRLCAGSITAITGTNGKTTTTALTGFILNKAGLNCHILGNIGIPFSEKVLDIKDDEKVVLEISSYQLESVDYFHPKVSAILNITPDHLKRHGTMEKYTEEKARIYANTNADDNIILNWDNDVTRNLKPDTGAEIWYFSRIEVLKRGAWVENDIIYVNIGSGTESIIKVDDVQIKGNHNLEDALAASLMAKLNDVNVKVIAKSLKQFKGVEHRCEVVGTYDGITYINDSKGTNTDSSIKAVESMDKPTVIIAGGYDKQSEYDDYILSFKDTIKAMVVLGETADKIIKTADRHGYKPYYKVETFEEAVRLSSKLAKKGWNVLLSPACASWGMFDDYEHRGRVFKELVAEIAGID